MSDDRPYGIHTLILPFVWVGGPAAAPRVARMTRLRARGALFQDRGVAPPDAQADVVSEAPGWGQAPRSYAPVPAALPASGRYRIEPPVIMDAPYDTAAINYDPRQVPLSAAAEEMEKIIDGVTQQVVSAAQGEFDALSRQTAAIKLHARLAAALNDLHIPGLKTEETIAPAGDVDRYGLDGAVRTDVTYRNPVTNEAQAIWDYKVGRASLSRARAQELAEFAAGVHGKPDLARQIPIREIKIQLIPGP